MGENFRELEASRTFSSQKFSIVGVVIGLSAIRESFFHEVLSYFEAIRKDFLPRNFPLYGSM